MILPRFEIAEPATVKEACAILEKNPNARVIAGGTDLLVILKTKVFTTDLVVSLLKIAELKTISFSEKAGLSIGPLATITEIETSPVILKNYPLLAKAAGKIGSAQIRNRATIGGNICSARPAGDTIGPLIALGASVKIAGSRKNRSELISGIFKGPGETTIGRNEILTGITIKTPVAKTGSEFIKYGIRNAMEIAMVSVTTLINLKGDACASAKIVAGAVGPTFIECEAAEKYLAGKKISDDTAAEAGRLAMESCRPRSSTRASAEYRRQLVQVFVKRGLLESAASAH